MDFNITFVVDFDPKIFIHWNFIIAWMNGIEHGILIKVKLFHVLSFSIFFNP